MTTSQQSVAGTAVLILIKLESIRVSACVLCSNPLIHELSLYDVVGTEGVAADLSHIDTDVKVSTCCT